MKIRCFVLLSVALLFVANAEKRIISIGTNMTETLWLLGAGDEIIGRDSASNFPEQVKKLPVIGGGHKYSPEGIVALKPTHVFVDVTRTPMTRLIQALKGAGIVVEAVKVEPSLEGAFASIRQVASAVEKEQKGEELISAMKKKSLELQAFIKDKKDLKKALFVYARGMKTLFVAGQKTTAEGLFELAGLRNGVSSFENFRPLTAEAVVSSEAEYIVIFESGLQSLGGTKNLKKVPGVALTPAAQSDQIITIKQEAMSFSPRVVDFAFDLAKQVYGE